MATKYLIIFVVALNLCEFAMSSDVAKAFVGNEVVPDAVDAAPQEEIKVENVKFNSKKPSKKYEFNPVLCRSLIRAAYRSILEMN